MATTDYYPNPIPGGEDLPRVVNDELIRLRNAIVTEPFTLIGATGAPAFQNSWVNYGLNNHTEAGFYIDPFDRVWLKGVIKSGTVPSVAFTVPSGYRPVERHVYSSVDGTGTPSARIDVYANGDVQVAGGNNAFISLDGISWRI